MAGPQSPLVPKRVVDLDNPETLKAFLSSTKSILGDIKRSGSSVHSRAPSTVCGTPTPSYTRPQSSSSQRFDTRDSENTPPPRPRPAVTGGSAAADAYAQAPTAKSKIDPRSVEEVSSRLATLRARDDPHPNPPMVGWNNSAAVAVNRSYTPANDTHGVPLHNDHVEAASVSALDEQALFDEQSRMLEEEMLKAQRAFEESQVQAQREFQLKQQLFQEAKRARAEALAQAQARAREEQEKKQKELEAFKRAQAEAEAELKAKTIAKAKAEAEAKLRAEAEAQAKAKAAAEAQRLREEAEFAAMAKAYREAQARNAAKKAETAAMAKAYQAAEEAAKAEVLQKAKEAAAAAKAIQKTEEEDTRRRALLREKKFVDEQIEYFKECEKLSAPRLELWAAQVAKDKPHPRSTKRHRLEVIMRHSVEWGAEREKLVKEGEKIDKELGGATAKSSATNGNPALGNRVHGTYRVGVDMVTKAQIEAEMVLQTKKEMEKAQAEAVEVKPEEKSKEHETVFTSWPEVQKRTNSAKIRRAKISNLPVRYTPTRVVRLIWGGPVEKLQFTTGDSYAYVQFLKPEDCKAYFDATPNGIDVPGEGRFVDVTLDEAPTSINDITRLQIEGDMTRCVRVVGVADNVGMSEIERLANAKRRKVERILNGRNSTGNRIVEVRFLEITEAYNFRSDLMKDPEWEHCNIQFARDPCQIYHGVHED